MENKFIILIQVGNSVDPSWWEEDGPLMFNTEEEAKKYHSDDWEERKILQQEDVQQGLLEPDEVDTEPEDWVSPCTVDENGCIRTPDDGLIYDPKTYVR